jgi:TonB family protein
MNRVLVASVLFASLSLPAAAKTSQPADETSASTPVRVSTGVVGPTLESSTDLLLPVSLSNLPTIGDAQVELSLTVDENGRTQNIRVVKPANSFLAARIVEAVSKFHYKPGTVDGQPVPVDLDLTVNITR